MIDTPTQKPRVWGIGLTRTGTTSLNRALQILGYKSVHWPTTGELLYGDFEAATDESVSALYRYLDARFPGSKFILTERDEASWIRSTRAHRARFAPKQEDIFRNAQTMGGVWAERALELTFTQMTLYGTLEFDERKFLEGYRDYYRKVTDYFSNRDADILRFGICVGERWDKLCAFLECDAPDATFPRENPTPGKQAENQMHAIESV